MLDLWHDTSGIGIRACGLRLRRSTPQARMPTLHFFGYAGNSVYELSIGQIFQVVEGEPLTVTPARIVPAGQNGKMFLPLAHALTACFQGRGSFSQFLIERDRLAF